MPDTAQTSRGKTDRFHRTPAELTTPALGWPWTSRSFARSSGWVGLVSGSCPSGRGFAPRFLQTPPRDDALALRRSFAAIGLDRGLAPPTCQPCSAHQKRGRPDWPPSRSCSLVLQLFQCCGSSVRVITCALQKHPRSCWFHHPSVKSLARVPMSVEYSSTPNVPATEAGAFRASFAAVVTVYRRSPDCRTGLTMCRCRDMSRYAVYHLGQRLCAAVARILALARFIPSPPSISMSGLPTVVHGPPSPVTLLLIGVTSRWMVTGYSIIHIALRARCCRPHSRDLANIRPSALPKSAFRVALGVRSNRPWSHFGLVCRPAADPCIRRLSDEGCTPCRQGIGEPLSPTAMERQPEACCQQERFTYRRFVSQTPKAR